MSRESIRPKCLGKEATRVAMPGWRQQQNVSDLKPFNFHFRILIEFPDISETITILACGATYVNSPEPLRDTGRDPDFTYAAQYPFHAASNAGSDCSSTGH
jgi:hypothetical protein